MTDKIEITPELLADLKARAGKATPGPWVEFGLESGNGNSSYTVGTEKPGLDICRLNSQLYCKNCLCNAAYIAAASPAVVLALIEEIERLEEDFDAAARSAADESVKAVKLEEEAEWLAKQASLMCDCIENCDECRLFSECGCNGQNSKEIWRKAAQEAISQEEARIKEREPDA